MQLENNNKNYLKSIFAGIFGMLGLIMVYVLIMFLATKSVNQIIEQFIFFKYWIIALILGFGIQMGLFWHIRTGLSLSGGFSKTALATGAGTSTTAMIACCAHHLTDFLPILGLSATALFLSKYQTHLFLLGIISNVAGIFLMIYIIKTKKCPKFFNFKRKNMKKIILILGTGILLIGVIYVILKKSDSQSPDKYQLGQDTGLTQTDSNQYQTQTDSQSSVTIDVTPKQLGAEEKNIFTVSLNTHSVELDFDFTKIMVLKDDLGNLYSALEWTGSRGGHHLSGDIIFPEINKQAKNIELQINGIGGVNRVFKWGLLDR